MKTWVYFFQNIRVLMHESCCCSCSSFMPSWKPPSSSVFMFSTDEDELSSLWLWCTTVMTEDQQPFSRDFSHLDAVRLTCLCLLDSFVLLLSTNHLKHPQTSPQFCFTSLTCRDYRESFFHWGCSNIPHHMKVESPFESVCASQFQCLSLSEQLQSRSSQPLLSRFTFYLLSHLRVGLHWVSCVF